MSGGESQVGAEAGVQAPPLQSGSLVSPLPGVGKLPTLMQKPQHTVSPQSPGLYFLEMTNCFTQKDLKYYPRQLTSKELAISLVFNVGGKKPNQLFFFSSPTLY